VLNSVRFERNRHTAQLLAKQKMSAQLRTATQAGTHLRSFSRARTPTPRGKFSRAFKHGQIAPRRRVIHFANRGILHYK
jgi:hypothetical protein